MEEVPALGRITVDREVLETIARLTALAVPGVARIAPVPRSRLLGSREGVRITLQDGSVLVDLYLVVESGHNMLALGRQVQAEVTRAIQEMVGLDVEAVNVYIEDVVPASR
ncbi:MAG: Asp23/Gls24 family envelope stress response protein [Anaerolineae bacterium]